MKHTPEPWIVSIETRTHALHPDGYDVYFIGPTWRLSRIDTPKPGEDWDPIAEIDQYPDARRIVACVNACQGIATERLEEMRIGHLLQLDTFQKIFEEQFEQTRQMVMVNDEEDGSA